MHDHPIADAPWVAPTTAIVAAVLMLAVGLQRDAFTSPSWDTVLVLIAGVPWFIDSLTRKFPRSLWIVMTVGATTVMFGARTQELDYAPFFLVYLAGTMATVLDTKVSAVVAALAIAPGIVLDVASDVDGSVIWLFGTTMAWFFGYGFRAQLSLLGDLQRAQAEVAESAALAERQRVAREVHDLIAHSLSVSMLHVTGARLALADGDTDEALAGLEQAEKTGREAMTEIRRTVGLLGPGSATAPPAPGAIDVPTLVDGFRDAGLAVDLSIEGDLTTVASGPGLALYRVVQESLTNVAKHGAGAARVAVVVREGLARVEVSGPAPATVPSGNDGLGILGMKERVGLLGGSLSAGPTGGDWVVDASIPL